MEGKRLLLEVGNSRIHMGWGTDRVEGTARLDPGDPDGIGDRWASDAGSEMPEDIFLASVVPRVTEAIRTWVNRHWAVPIRRYREEIPAFIDVDVPDPDQVGDDRLLNALAVTQFYGAPAIVVDSGTATSIDIITDSGAFAGGLIGPGVQMSANALHRDCALLPRVEPGVFNEAFGTDTESAIRGGLYHGFRGFIREIRREVSREMEGDVTVVGLGGDIHLIEGNGLLDAVDHLLTLKGLLHAGNRDRNER